MPLVFLHLFMVAISQSTDQLIFDTIGSTGPLILAGTSPIRLGFRLDTSKIFSLVFTIIWTS